MDLSLQSGSIADIETPLAVIGVFADEELPALLGDLITRDDFSGDWKKTLLLVTGGQRLKARKVMLVGLGKRAEATAERARRAYALATIRARDAGVTQFAVALPAIAAIDPNTLLRAVADGVLLASYTFDQFKGAATQKRGTPTARIERVTLVGEGDPAVVELARTVFKGVKLARDLGNEPPRVCTPTRFADVAREIAERGNLQLTVLDREQMQELGMGGMLGVSQAAHEPPKFIVLEYGHKGQGRTIALVGKGITFDSGGISIKPAEKMDLMKMDMAGAAAVLGAMSVLADLKLPNVHVIGIICATENLPGGGAFKPGDILRAMNGVTMEIINTDAEGRLVLADGLSYAQRYEPDAIIDLATLTGAVVVALGTHITGMITNNAELAARVREAGERTGELVWELPLLPEYQEAVRSKIADIKNSAGRNAGSITAGAFLEHFVADRPWVHLDIAGTAWVEEPPKPEDQPKPYQTRGATGVGVRLLIDLLQRYADAA